MSTFDPNTATAGDYTVLARFATRDNAEGEAPDWSEPRQVTLRFQRFPPSKKRNAIQWDINILDFGWAEYTDRDYCGNGKFLCEQYRMHVLEVINCRRPQTFNGGAIPW